MSKIMDKELGYHSQKRTYFISMMIERKLPGLRMIKFKSLSFPYVLTLSILNQLVFCYCKEKKMLVD